MYFIERYFRTDLKLQRWLWSLESLDTLLDAFTYLLPSCVRKEFLQKHFISGVYSKFQAIVEFHTVIAVHQRELRIIKITALGINHNLNSVHPLGAAHCICAMSNWTQRSSLFHISASLSRLKFFDDSSCLSCLPVGVLFHPPGNYNEYSSCYFAQVHCFCSPR